MASCSSTLVSSSTTTRKIISAATSASSKAARRGGGGSSSSSTGDAACGLCDLRRTITTTTSTITPSIRSTDGVAALHRRFASTSSTTPPSSSTSVPSSSSSRIPPSPRPSSLIRPVRIVPPKLTTPNSTIYKQRKVKRGQAKPLTATEREQELARLYALRSIPPPSALAALANRISPHLFGSKSDSSITTTTAILQKLEQCCTCESFWQVVDEHLAKSKDDGQRGELEEGDAALFTNYLDADRLHNESLSVLGNHLLGVFALEWLESRYPHLPERAMKAALTLYVGPRTCADIATKQWGINSGQASRQAFLPTFTGPSPISPSHKPGQPLRGVGEGNRAGTGLLRWGRSEASRTKETLEALYEKSAGAGSSSSSSTAKEGENRTPLPLEEALASVTRAIVGLVFQEHGFAAARTFVHDTFLTRQADITSLLKFPNPKYTLSATLAKYGRAAPVTRLIAETGRLSIAPIFVTGVYSDRIKLGEGYGSSLQMAEYRACEDALRRIYLSPLASQAEAISDLTTPPAAGEQSKAQFAAPIELPSDTLVYPGKTLRVTRPLADDEILWQSGGRSGGVAV